MNEELIGSAEDTCAFFEEGFHFDGLPHEEILDTDTTVLGQTPPVEKADTIWMPPKLILMSLGTHNC